MDKLRFTANDGILIAAYLLAPKRNISLIGDPEGPSIEVLIIDVYNKIGMISLSYWCVFTERKFMIKNGNFQNYRKEWTMSNGNARDLPIEQSTAYAFQINTREDFMHLAHNSFLCHKVSSRM